MNKLKDNFRGAGASKVATGGSVKLYLNGQEIKYFLAPAHVHRLCYFLAKLNIMSAKDYCLPAGISFNSHGTLQVTI